MHGMTREQTLEFNREVIETFRHNGGAMPAGHPLHGNPTLLLTSTGAKTGCVRISPLTFTEDGDEFIVMASAGGSPTLPAWAVNLRAHPEAVIEVGEERFEAIAVETVGAARERALQLMTTALPRFATYQSAVDRVIPLFRLRRR